MVQASIANGSSGDHVLQQIGNSLFRYSEKNSLFENSITSSTPHINNTFHFNNTPSPKKNKMLITHQLKIIQLNIKSIRSSKQMLEHYLHVNNIDIAILSETWLKKDEQFYIQNYNIQSSSRHNVYGGVAIATKKDIRFVTRLDYSYEPIEFIELTTTNLTENLQIVSVYLPPNTNYNTSHINSKFKSLIDHYNNIENTIIAGDINAHNPLWESNHISDTRGDAFAEIILDSNLIILNNGDHIYQSVFSSNDHMSDLVSIS